VFLPTVLSAPNQSSAVERFFFSLSVSGNIPGPSPALSCRSCSLQKVIVFFPRRCVLLFARLPRLTRHFFLVLRVGTLSGLVFDPQLRLAGCEMENPFYRFTFFVLRFFGNRLGWFVFRVFPHGGVSLLRLACSPGFSTSLGMSQSPSPRLTDVFPPAFLHSFPPAATSSFCMSPHPAISCLRSIFSTPALFSPCVVDFHPSGTSAPGVFFVVCGQFSFTPAAQLSRAGRVSSPRGLFFTLAG